ncbi:UAA-domain-containing protein [Epithele typhae]|uniref:UAA-domain-containing protein n=1 Tax=Epithele typhae TaxID=378194 RepID=UPI0020082B85|nr:UAA-domain-containing protein [Epithele typhae]KAH9935882.1 UAA-domain-containing protein [Epithele typhae]
MAVASHSASKGSKKRRNGATVSHTRPNDKAVAPSAAQAPASANGKNGWKELQKALAASLVDYTFVLGLVFGGCCSNVWSYEQLLKMDAHIGTTLTFSQMLFITVQSLPSFLDFAQGVPRLKPRHVPLRNWAMQVLVLTSGSLMNNWVYAFSVPLTVQIVFRSAGQSVTVTPTLSSSAHLNGVRTGLAVSMLFGYVIMNKRYSLAQMLAVAVVSAGVVLATLFRPSTPKTSDVSADVSKYTTGVVMLVLSLFTTAILGILQERTYTKYGPHWKEGVFYTHLLSLPIFLFFISDLKRGFQGLAQPVSIAPFPKESLGSFTPWIPYAVLGANMFTQLACVSGVNQLSARVSSVSTSLVLTTRKAISLCFSVWWFGNGWNAQLGVGAGMVFLGSLLYTVVTARSAPVSAGAVRRSVSKSKEE